MDLNTALLIPKVSEESQMISAIVKAPIGIRTT